MCQAGYKVEYSLRLQDLDPQTAMCSDCTKDFLNMAFRQQLSEYSAAYCKFLSQVLLYQ